MRFKIVPSLYSAPPPDQEPLVLVWLQIMGNNEFAVMAQVDGDSSSRRFVLVLGEGGVRRKRWASGLGLPTDEEGRVVDCTGER